MSRENQDMTMDLEDVMHERDQLRMKLQEHSDKISALEHSLNLKVFEFKSKYIFFTHSKSGHPCLGTRIARCIGAIQKNG